MDFWVPWKILIFLQDGQPEKGRNRKNKKMHSSICFSCPARLMLLFHFLYKLQKFNLFFQSLSGPAPAISCASLGSTTRGSRWGYLCIYGPCPPSWTRWWSTCSWSSPPSTLRTTRSVCCSPGCGRWNRHRTLGKETGRKVKPGSDCSLKNKYSVYLFLNIQHTFAPSASGDERGNTEICCVLSLITLILQVSYSAADCEVQS